MDTKDIIVIKLISGEEVIVESIEDGILAKNPHIIMFVRGEQEGQVGIHMGPLVPYSKKDKDGDFFCVLGPSVLAFMYQPDEQLAESFQEMLKKQKSSLILPESSGKIVLPE